MLRAKKWGIVLAGLLLCVITLAFCFNGAPLAVSAADSQQSVESEAPPIQPRFGGKVSRTVSVGQHDVFYEITAENYAWPGADRAVIKVSSNSKYLNISLNVNFIWVTADNNVDMQTNWQEPQSKGFNDGKYVTIPYYGTTDPPHSEYRWICACDDSRYISGAPGHKWACGYIDVTLRILVNDVVPEVKEFSERVWF